MIKFVFSFLLLIISCASKAQELFYLPEATLVDPNLITVPTSSISNGDSPTVVVTYASWSPVSIAMLDELSGSYFEERKKSGVKIVAINCENTLTTNDVVAEASEQHQWYGFQLLHDRTRSFMNASKTRSVAKVFFLDANRNVIYCVESCDIPASKIYSIAASIKNKKIVPESVYFDSNWFPCEKPEAVYYRKIVKDSPGKFLVTDFFMNDQIQMQGICTLVYPRYRSGVFIYYYQSGQKKQSGPYTGSEKTGPWSTWHEDGHLQSKATYVEDKKEGRAQEFYPNGVLESEGNYYTGIPDSIWTSYYQNGEKRIQTQWNKGLKERSIGWYENGTLKFKVASYANNYPSGIETYYSNGQRVSQFIYNSESALTEIRQYYASGELKSTGKIENNKVGYSEHYTSGKQKMAFTQNQEHNLDGKFFEWYENGNKKTEMEFSNGKAINKGMLWYENGKQKEKIDFTAIANGKKRKSTAVSELKAFDSMEKQALLFSQTIDFYMSMVD